MVTRFLHLFTREYREENGILRFGGEGDGDCFDESDFVRWRRDVFRKNWEKTALADNAASRRLLDEIIDRHDPVIDIASGPGMGLIPSLKRLSPSLLCLATDASFDVLNEWRKFLSDKEYRDLAFAQFSLFDIPIRSGSVRTYSSYLGLSSTRGGEEGIAAALSEIRRTLSDDGFLYAIESEWTDVPAILRLFEKTGRQPWSCFLEERLPWHDRFAKNGFEIVQEAPYMFRPLTAEDNELGEMAEGSGVEVIMKYTAFVTRKTGS